MLNAVSILKQQLAFSNPFSKICGKAFNQRQYRDIEIYLCIQLFNRKGFKKIEKDAHSPHGLCSEKTSSVLECSLNTNCYELKSPF